MKLTNFFAIAAICALTTACSSETEKEAPKPQKKATKVAKKAPAPKAVATKQAAKPVASTGVEYEISITNGHLAKVILGINPKGTDGYDRGLDDMAPPPGMQTGYTSLVSPDRKHYLYRDTRAPGNKIEWIFFADVYQNKPVTIKWNSAKLPGGYKWSLIHAEAKTKVDMTKETSYKVDKKAAFKLVAEKI